MIKMTYSQYKEWFMVHLDYIVIVLTPLILLPLLMNVGTNEAKCAFVILVMSIYWITDVLHLAAVSLIPIFAFPMLGILDSDDVCQVYMNDANVVFLSSLIAGAALEASGIHKRIALIILMKIGTSPRLLLLGIMLATMCMSTWIMDIASCAMMIPIVEAIMRHLESVDSTPEEVNNDDDDDSDTNVMTDETGGTAVTSVCNSVESLTVDHLKLHQNMMNGNLPAVIVGFDHLSLDGKAYSVDQESVHSHPQKAKKPKVSGFEKCLILAVAYSSAIGGIGTLTGTTTNLVFKQLLVKMYGGTAGVSYATWMLFGIPTMVVCVLALCVMLQIFYLRCSVKRESPERKRRISAMLVKHYEELGGITYHECAVLLCLILLLCLWFFRTPEFIYGWQDFLKPAKEVTDSAPAYMVILLLCILPAKVPITKENKSRLVEWEVVEKRIPWDILLLQGAGLAMAAASDSSGLTRWLGTQFAVLNFMPSPVVCYLISLITAFMSEIICNSSLAAMLLPVMANLAEQLHVNPLYLMLPITFAATLTFTLPIASGPNAIAYKTGKLKLTDMFKTGILANILTVSIMFAMANSLGAAIFGLQTFPSWANVSLDSLVTVTVPSIPIGIHNFTDIVT